MRMDAFAMGTVPVDGGLATPKLPRAPAVLVHAAKKCYVQGQWILDGLDLTVPEASIYALLGASGCGKTTLLTCMLGLRHLNAGTVRVMGWRPGDPGSGIPGPRVGFMPQELGLSEGFSIRETMIYFGRVAGLPDDVIRQRSNDLLKFLDITAKQSRLLSQLSGGQKQRVSLAVTLLHSPPLLILDEPTVGVDPVLRQNIWDFLVDLTRTSGTTVIITTHYIEEARQANKVGLMRRGKLLDEDDPDAMMAKHNCATLEDVFLNLSIRQEGVQVTTEPSQEAKRPEHQAVERRHIRQAMEQYEKPAQFPQHSNVMACLWRAWLYITRYKWVTAYVVFMPVLCIFVYLFAVGRDPHGLHVAIVNDDSADQCAAGWPGYPTDCEQTAAEQLSCRFLALLKEKHDYILDLFDDMDSARTAVLRGHAWGVLNFPANFSYHMTQRQLYMQDATEADFDGSEADAHIDMSNQYLGNMVRDALFRTTIRFHDDLQKGCNLNPRIGAIPINQLEPVFGNNEPSFQNFALPGVLLCVMYFPAIFYSTANFLEDKLNGVMGRSAAAGVTQFEMLAARAILDCAMNALSTAIVIFITFVVLQFTNNGSYILLSLLMYLQGLCGLSLGYFVASLCPDHYSSTFMGMGIFFLSTFVSGMFWPSQGMHWFVKMLAPFTPMMLSVEGARTILYQSSNPKDIGEGFLATGTWTAATFLATMLIIRWQNKRG
ncbi:ABC transporter G family member 23-like [Thrips palmi]|uniref:ABC transporter G family member 23-like n=1 Tax=Thrips palmi TaxID=161013 RepID=A0A6P9A549_THRPL|nr:ABC transporter G family member 23-like [Thrips palmi]